MAFTRSAGSSSGHGVSVASASYRVGEQYGVYYDPAHPDDVILDSWGDKWGVPTLFLGIGIVLLVASVIPTSRR